KCWGGNDFGQLGLGDTRDRGRWANYMGVNLPSVDLGANWTIVEVAAGGGHTCARLENGAARALKCWGWNMLGQLGLGDTLTRGGEGGSMGDSLPAVQLGTGRSAVALALGTRHSCALLDDASVKCWGRNKNGDLGLGDSQNRGDGAGEMGEALPAVDLGAGRTVVQLAAGSHHTCALLDNGQLKCWGRNFRGQLGIGDMVDRGRGIRNDMGANLPSVDVGAGWTVVEVAAGATHTCTRLKNGAARALKCWGYNAAGQLDLGDTNYRGYVEEGMGDSLPAVQLGTGRSAVVLALGSYHSCALLDDASVKCWGRNREGQLGLGDVNNRGDGGGGMDDSLPAVPL
ncbi:regulator of chromosome condensation 1/beta-lactamase-inhibitor protein II, partial [Baffinella frigidus]